MLIQGNVCAYPIAEMPFFNLKDRIDWTKRISSASEGKRGSRSDLVFIKAELRGKYLCQALCDGCDVISNMPKSKAHCEIHKSQIICDLSNENCSYSAVKKTLIFCVFFNNRYNFGENKIVVKIPTEPNLIFRWCDTRFPRITLETSGGKCYFLICT